MAAKIVRWLVFSVVIALMPLVLNYFSMRVKGINPTLVLMFSRGELLLVSGAIAAGAIGELVASGDERRIAKYVTGGGCVIVLFLASGVFVEISNAIHSGASVNDKFVSASSALTFVFTVILGTICIFLAELGK